MVRAVLSVMVTLIMGVFVAGPVAAADIPCAERNDVTNVLRERFGETPQSMGLSANGSLLEVFVSPAGSWTLLVSYPDGKSCMVAEGEAWERATVEALAPVAKTH